MEALQYPVSAKAPGAHGPSLRAGLGAGRAAVEARCLKIDTPSVSGAFGGDLT